MFHKASLRLAALYLAVIMLISLFFSVNIYQLSLDELDRGLRHPDTIQQDGNNIAPIDLLPRSIRSEFRQYQEFQYEQARDRTLERLAITNVFILIGGGALSYFLARRTLKPIEEAHAAQSRFTADASHELRTPIAAMQTEIEVTLMDPSLTLPKAKKTLLSNLEELVKLTALTEGLLKLAQMENGAIEQEEIAVSDITQEAITRVLPLAEAKRINIISNDETDAKIMGDKASITEAVVVLVDNAIKYSPEKTEITINVKSDQKRAYIEIIDQGMGIKPKDVDHIFERFYRADTARSKTETGGYGVGLAIAKNIIDAHGGLISVVSKANKGSTFTIQLPVVNPAR